MHLLRLETQGRDRARIQPGDPDRVAGFFAIAVRAVFDALERRVDLADQLALPVARPELQGTIALRRRPVGHVRMVLALFLEVLQRLATFAKDIFLPGLELLAEVFPLPRV